MGENLKNLSEILEAKKIAIVVAHPDDEIFYFSNLLILFGKQVQIICVTDANYEGDGAERLFKMSELALRLTDKPLICCQMTDCPFVDLNLELIKESLLRHGLSDFDLIFTHSPHGDYGHLNHRDVFFAVNKACPRSKVFFPADYVFPDYQLFLEEQEYRLKQSLIEDYYLKEFRQFWKIGRLSSIETYAVCNGDEINELHKFFIEGDSPDEMKLKKYNFFWKVLSRQGRLPNL